MKSAAVAGCGVAVGALLGAWLASRGASKAEKTAGERAQQAGEESKATVATGIPDTSEDDAARRRLLQEQLSRNRRFFGDGPQDAIEDAFVIVVGLGGVGSHAAHMLVRSGVANIRLIDFDNVTLSSLNRHAVAVRADVGRPKAVVLAEFFHKFAPHAKVDPRVTLFEKDAADDLLAGNPAYVVDCIDDVTTKTDLLAYCHTHGLPVVSAMAAGAKADPTRIHLCDLADTVDDPLAARVRHDLKKRGITRGIDVVYSSEKATRKLCDLEGEAAEAPHEFGAMDNFRVRVLPVLGTTPAVFGNAAAAHVLCHLASQPFAANRSPRLWPSKTVATHLDRLLSKERKIYDNPAPLDFGLLEMDAVLHYVFKYRSVVSGTRFSLQLARWDVTKPPTLDNVVLLGALEAKQMLEEGRASFGEDVVRAVDALLATIPAGLAMAGIAPQV